MGQRQRLTDRIVDALPLPSKGNIKVWDAPDRQGRDWVPGFGVQLSAGGSRSFIYSYRTLAGRQRQVTIGSRPVWSTEAARGEARELALRVAKGADPQAEKKALREAETVSQLCDAFIKDHLTGKRTEADYRSMVERVRDELGTHKVAAVTRLDLQRLHRKTTERGKRGKGSPILANRLISTARAMFNFAIQQQWRADNPAVGIKPNPETKRERYLTPGELARLTRALDAYHHQDLADIFRLALLSGCRVGEALMARWVEFSDDLATWTKPASNTKQQKSHHIPLNSAARELLARISRTSKSDTVFRKIDYANVRRHWKNICRAADIRNLRIHDLRHSYASTLINQGVPLPTIGKLLGHSSVSTTERYSHLVHDTLREATELAGKALSGGLKVVRGGRR
jgi:integrase